MLGVGVPVDVAVGEGVSVGEAVNVGVAVRNWIDGVSDAGKNGVRVSLPARISVPGSAGVLRVPQPARNAKRMNIRIRTRLFLMNLLRLQLQVPDGF